MKTKARKAVASKTPANGKQEPPVEVDDAGEFEHVELSNQEVSEAVVFNTDWTTETVTAQTENVHLSPNFQRRDAWSLEKKSRFIESLILGLPVPPIILAEQKRSRGKFLVIDGKQRLLSIMQFWGKLPETSNNSYALRGLDVREDLNGLTFAQLKSVDERANDYSALRNQPIRTVVIRNWPKDDFLHLVFLRLNTGSVRLSAQELRQALKPGAFTSRVDAYASDDEELRMLLGLKGPDPRMQDTELLGRHVAFANFIERYPGRLKTFIDEAFETLNDEWEERSKAVEAQFAAFDDALKALFELFGERNVARKAGSRLLNKALLDPLLYYFAFPQVRSAVARRGSVFRRAFEKTLQDERFQEAISLDTASAAGTEYRFGEVAQALKAAGVRVKRPHRSQSGFVLR